MPERKRRAERYEELPPEPVNESTPPQSAASGVEPLLPLPHDVVATNTGVRLACTMAAMIGLFALFLCWVEKESRAIRRFAVQSATLTAAHALTGVAALLLSTLLGGVPYLGMIVTLLCLLFYIAVLTLLIVVRVRLMQRAWQGVRYDLPAAVERLIARYY